MQQQDQQLQLAVQLLRQDRVIAFPTDTVYGLGGDPRSELAIRRVFELKNRSYTTPLPILIPSIEHLAYWVDLKCITDKLLALANAFWPGGLTIVANKASHVSEFLTAGQATIAVRMPNHPLIQQLLHKFNSAIIGTSANQSGQPSLTDHHQVQQAFDNQEVLVLNGHPCSVGVESTIVLVTNEIKILRLGAISASQLQSYL